ncbi:bifunctional histidinol-phosphatase/imidazoleglycerol-phosphate dehydratase HisB [Enterobacteriaceae endosymbiont of Plateumaris consimilis]|uniref:bifunctional histidinol-phosphatase/imidazoleglycerol-phosphate dehydratase HisB n=1 Tax=Enterobacteriaceae endosymbiont of Plateumaris consimilis TaxID=2675794 RepID=UPI001449E1C2|nr:bifunctional histidinol-phosphatase/imidazoleglycerol-phosphate dehydratase HisB [Enterobacteriaceae endosymbiont of Plateumaris consimilis]QJC28538.1 bifunctional histidinol-phosphatase/imidazoleglycerol-phosphate dehydratase HisB [Enterobacteriaceae endosymbiont of Plateumaris consimilis]
MLNKVLFIDRDGTLISEPDGDHQIDHINKLIFEPNVIITLSQLIKFSYSLVIITNQDGLGSKNFPKQSFDISHNFMINVFKSQGIEFKNVFICPHYLKDNCICRKPKITMLKSYLNNTLDKKNSYVIGDRLTDMELSKNIGIQGILYNKNKYNWNNILLKLTKNNRYAIVKKITKETIVLVEVWLDKKGKSSINTGINFFNHMLEQIAIHGDFILNINVQGDLHIDDHHTIEDTALTLGSALLKALAYKKGINRFGFVLPMDDSLAECAIDLSGRPYLQYYATFNHNKIGDFNTEMVKHFFYSLSYSMLCNIYLKVKGDNDHHKIESLFKSFGKSLKQAINIINDVIPSSKGIL